MRVLMVVASLLLGLIPAPAHAQSPVFIYCNGNKLLRDCQSSEPLETVACGQYILAASDTYLAFMNALERNPAYCLRKTVMVRQLQDVVLAYLI